MSNLSTAILFDVTRGWPHGGGLAEEFVPDPNGPDTLLEGHLVDQTGNGIALATETNVATSIVPPNGLYMVIQGNDQSDAQSSGRITVLRGNFSVRTEKVDAASDLVTVPAPAGTPVSYNAVGEIDDENHLGIAPTNPGVDEDHVVIGFVEQPWDGTSMVIALKLKP
jgi:hypothetical protein